MPCTPRFSPKRPSTPSKYCGAHRRMEPRVSPEGAGADANRCLPYPTVVNLVKAGAGAGAVFPAFRNPFENVLASRKTLHNIMKLKDCAASEVDASRCSILIPDSQYATDHKMLFDRPWPQQASVQPHAACSAGLKCCFTSCP